MKNNIVLFTTYEYASSRELEECSWWGLVDKNKFVLVNNRVSNEVTKNSIVITNHIPTIMEKSRVDVSIRRYSKLDVFDVMEYYGIKHPKAVPVGVFTASTLAYRMSNLSLDNDLNLNTDDLVTLRCNNSSRGLGNIVIKIDNLPELAYTTQVFRRRVRGLKESEMMELCKEFRMVLDTMIEPRVGYGDYRSWQEEYQIEEFLLTKSSQVLMQEYINLPLDEYRLYLTYDMDSLKVSNLIGIKRKGYGLTSKRDDMVDMQIPADEMKSMFEDDGFKDIISKLLFMIKDQKHLVVSVDLYKIHFGSIWGVFEFSTEYSMEGLSMKHILKLKDHINSSLDLLYRNKIKDC